MENKEQSNFKREVKVRLSDLIVKWKAVGVDKNEALIKAKSVAKTAGKNWTSGMQEIFDTCWRKKVDKVEPSERPIPNCLKNIKSASRLKKETVLKIWDECQELAKTAFPTDRSGKYWAQVMRLAKERIEERVDKNSSKAAAAEAIISSTEDIEMGVNRKIVLADFGETHETKVATEIPSFDETYMPPQEEPTIRKVIEIINELCRKYKFAVLKDHDPIDGDTLEFSVMYAFNGKESGTVTLALDRHVNNSWGCRVYLTVKRGARLPMTNLCNFIMDFKKSIKMLHIMQDKETLIR